MRALLLQINALTVYFEGVLFNCAHLKWLSSAASNNAMHTNIFEWYNIPTPKSAGAAAGTGSHAPSALLYRGELLTPHRLHPSNTTLHAAGCTSHSRSSPCVQCCGSAAIRTQSASKHLKFSSGHYCLRGVELSTCNTPLSKRSAAAGLSCKPAYSKPAHAAAAGGAAVDTQLLHSRHTPASSSGIAATHRSAVAAAAAVITEDRLQLQQIRSYAGRSAGSVDVGSTAGGESSNSSRRHRSNHRQDDTDGSSMYAVSSTSTSSSRRRRQQPVQVQFAETVTYLNVTTRTANNITGSSSSGTQASRRRRQQITDNVSSASMPDEVTDPPHTKDSTQAANHMMQQQQQLGKQQQQASRALLLGIDPDTNGAVAVVAATLLPYTAANSSSSTGDTGVHSSSSSGNSGRARIDSQGTQQQQQLQLVDFHNASVAVFDMPTEHIPLKKKTKMSPQRYRRRLDISQTIALIKQVIQQQQEQQQELVPGQSNSRNGSSTTTTSSSSSSEILVRAVLEVSSITPTNGSLAIFNQGYSTAAWQAALLALGVQVSTVHVKHWKKDMGLLRRDKDDSRLLAQQLFSAAGQCQQHIISRKKDHGRAEALLIAAWGCGWSCTPGSSSASSSSGGSWILHQGPLRAALQMDGGMHVLASGDTEAGSDVEDGDSSSGSGLIMPAAAKGSKRAKKPKEPKRKTKDKKKQKSGAAAAAAVDVWEDGETASSSGSRSRSEASAVKLVTSARRKRQKSDS